MIQRSKEYVIKQGQQEKNGRLTEKKIDQGENHGFEDSFHVLMSWLLEQKLVYTLMRSQIKR